MPPLGGGMKGGYGMVTDAVRHFFPGSNTGAGFVGFFENLRSQAGRTVILKGGPGVGKSSLMKAVGQHYEEKKTPVVYYHCSGDPDSLDAVFVPERGYLMLDGTAPHIVDPALPGAADGILNLGVCLDEKQLSGQREDVERLNREISACYAQAYRYLRAARAMREDAGAVCDAALSRSARHAALEELLSYFPEPCGDGESHLFAQAITWKGVLQYLDGILTGKTVCLDAPWGFDAHGLLSDLWQIAGRKQMYRAAYHDPLDAARFGHIQTGDAVFTTAMIPDAPAVTPQLDSKIMHREEPRLSFDRAVHDLALNQAVEVLANAKAKHDQLERYYIDAMDWGRLNAIRQETLEELPD